MKPILIAIDFSSTSIHALEYAIMIANKMNTNVIMTWVDKEITQNHIYSDTSGQNRVEALRRFRELSQKYGSSLKASLTFDCKLRKGKVYQEVVSQARNSDACMIITGSHGASGFEELMIGSNAFRIVSNSPIPVICIRPSFPVKKTIKHLILPIDHTPETLQKLSYIHHLAGFFKPVIHVLGLSSTPLNSLKKVVEKYVNSTTEYLKSHHHRFEVDILTPENIVKTTLEYAEAKDADLIVIMKDQETDASSILLGPYTQRLINQSPFPVLSLQAHENFSLKNDYI